MSIAPHLIIEQSSKEKSMQTVKIMQKIHKRCWTKHAVVNGKFMSSFFIGHHINTEKIFSKIPEPLKYYLDEKQFQQENSDELQDYIDQLLIPSSDALQTYLDKQIEQEKQSAIYDTNLAGLTKDSTVIFIDFEAFSTKPLYPSEIGCVRVKDGTILAQMHTFFSPVDIGKMKGSASQSIFYTEKITGIPAPWDPQFENCLPCCNHGTDLYDFGQILLEFCTASAQTLKNLNDPSITLIQKKFEAAETYFFCAKGIDLERQILTEQMKLQPKILEVEDVYKYLTNGKEITFTNIHSGRQFDYCKFHQKVKQNQHAKEMMHCALDDALYLAYKLCHGVYDSDIESDE
ncbi:Conserved_hypothetical protein [Hexamita inflata]|uniref:Uncharacterized protein n=1 Tax=Hexamita inflata TaxID=28002 RepID=A0AA86R7X0_9EUKA|nr:Conserved hypothetical protein [Hexamita inflata]